MIFHVFGKIKRYRTYVHHLLKNILYFSKYLILDKFSCAGKTEMSLQVKIPSTYLLLDKVGCKQCLF